MIKKTDKKTRVLNRQPYHFFFFFYHLFIYFKDLFTERACPQLAKANLGGPCLNKQITKEKKKKKYIYIYIQTKIN